VKFLVDRCAGHILADWLREQGHDVVESRERGKDPGDLILLKWATAEERILIPIDKDFGGLVFKDAKPHFGLIRLPDVPAKIRIQLMAKLFQDHQSALASRAIMTVSRGRIRISRQNN
jgi:predicted nuclease of predicted toxin-antitoxin system